MAAHRLLLSLFARVGHHPSLFVSAAAHCVRPVESLDQVFTASAVADGGRGRNHVCSVSRRSWSLMGTAFAHSGAVLEHDVASAVAPFRDCTDTLSTHNGKECREDDDHPTTCNY